jgi:hypothetical protein
MGNNDQQPLSNVLGQGLFSADGPLFLWEEFMRRALNEPWAWNDETPVGQTAFAEPEGITSEEVCRWTGMRATDDCGAKISVPFLDDFIPEPDNVHSRGCLDLVQYVTQAEPERPENWITGAQRWSDRFVNGQWGAAGDAAHPENPSTRYEIASLYGNPGFPSICGRIGASPQPLSSFTPASSSPQPVAPPTDTNATGDQPATGQPGTPPVPNVLIPAPLLLAAASALRSLRARSRR